MSWKQVSVDEHQDAERDLKYIGICWYCGLPSGVTWRAAKSAGPPLQYGDINSGDHEDGRQCIRALRDAGAIVLPIAEQPK